MLDSRQLVAAIWSISEGRGSDDDLALLRADQQVSLSVLDRLIIETEADLEAVRTLSGEEREQVVADFTDTLDGLRATAARLRPPPAKPKPAMPAAMPAGDDMPGIEEFRATPVVHREPDPVLLQASWSAGQVVVWAGGRGASPDGNDALATRLEEIGGPSVGWQLHPGVPLAGWSAGRGRRDTDEGRARDGWWRSAAGTSTRV